MIRTWLMLICVLAVPGVLIAQDKYAIKLKHAGAGDASLHTRELTKIEAVTVVGPDGNVAQEKKQTTVEVGKFTEEVIEKTAGQRATKVQRTYTEASVKTDGRSEKRAYDGKQVLIEKKGDVYHFTIDGTELKGEEAGDLPQAFNPKKPPDDEMDKLMLPAKPVGVGDTWQIEATKLTKLFGDDEKTAKSMDLDKAKATGKLTKAYKKDGRQYGVVEFQIDIPLKALEGMFPCKDGAKLVMSVVADGCIDGSVEADSVTFTMKASGTAEHVQDGQKTGVVIKFDISSTDKGSTTPVKK